MNSSKQIKLGALMSYFMVIFNMIAGLLYTHWMISEIGQSNYGLYTLATSFITMFVMDFGMSAAVSRFVAKYNAEGNQEKINNFLGVVYKLYILIAAIIFIVLVIVSLFIGEIYKNLSANEVETFKVLYVIVGLYSVISFPFINLKGILTAYEKFVQLRLADIFHKVFIIAAVVTCLLMGYGVYALVTVNAVSGLLTILIKYLIIKNKTPVKANLKFWDKKMLHSIFSFSFWTTISGLAQRLIFNITPSIIAMVSITGATGIAIFGLATTIEGYIYTFATALNGMFMARISKIIHSGKKAEELMPLMIRVGRLQCIIIGILTVGFIALGKPFITEIWNKPDFEISYICAVLLILPSFFYLPMEIANTTLIVENRVKQGSFVFITMGITNVCISLVLTKFYGAIGASMSIFIAYMIRNLLFTIIYKKVLKLDMPRFFKETYGKLVPQLLLTLLIGILFSRFNPIANAYLKFIVDGVVLVISYFIIMWICGFNLYEKSLIKSISLKRNRRKI